MRTLLALVLLGTVAPLGHSQPPAVKAGPGTPGPDAKLVAGLVQQLRDGDAGNRAKAAEALGKLGANAASAVPALVEALADTEIPVQVSARLALGRVGKSAVP